MFSLCQFERMMKFEDTTKANKLARWSKCTGRNMSSTLKYSSERRLSHPSKVVITMLKLDKDCKKILESKTKSQQLEKMQGK